MIENKKVLAVIPARGGSKGIPNKNIAPLRGKPLIHWTIEAAQGSQYIDRLILSSDDPVICESVEGTGCEVPFIRPAALATDDAKTIDVVVDAVDRLPGFDLVVVLQPTSPLRTSSDIDDCLELLVARCAPSVVSVAPVEEHPFLIYAIESGDHLRPFVSVPPDTSLRRQDLPPAYALNGAVYAADIEWLRTAGSFIATGAVGYVMTQLKSVDIDHQGDLERAAEYLAATHR